MVGTCNKLVPVAWPLTSVLRSFIHIKYPPTTMFFLLGLAHIWDHRVGMLNYEHGTIWHGLLNADARAGFSPVNRRFS